jgi:transglutaminase-like putative cysteine protease
MKISVVAELKYLFEPGTQIIAAVEAAQSADQDILSELLSVNPDADLKRDLSLEGDRRIRTVLEGPVTIRYQATVENRLRQLLPTEGKQEAWIALPDYVLPFLLPSRFCPSDKFMRFAAREFADAGDGVARVMAVLNWISSNVDYVHGVSDAETTAQETFVDRAGVCRDFTHLAITMCRALSIPARAVSAYAVDLDPPDFHAILEVYLGGQWWLIDPTRLAPIEGIVRIGSGRDAGDIAFLTTDRTCQLVEQSVAVSRA